jgi:hypothetical protein
MSFARSARFLLAIAVALGAGVLCLSRAAAQARGDVKTPPPAPQRPDVGARWIDPAASRRATGSLPSGRPAPPAIAPPKIRAPRPPSRLDPDEILFDEPGDGAVWAASTRYKASFAPSGATYYPFLGSCAPHDYPIRFALIGASAGGRSIELDAHASALRDGRRIVYDRGGVVEQYELAPGSMEQEFAFASLPAAGDLVLEIAVETELAASETEAAIRWSNDLGRVDYGRAFLVDARGRRMPIESRMQDDSIEIRVSAELLAGAAFPIRIDPVITTFTVDNSSNDDSYPDIAYDLANDVYQVVWQRTFSSTDHDCYSQLQSASGATVAGSTVAIDFTADDWRLPHTTNNRVAAQFLVAAEVLPSGFSTRIIEGRTRSAAGSTTGSQFQISDPAITSDQFGVTVGGDPNPVGPTYYCVVWDRFYNNTDQDVFARLVRTDSSLVGAGTIFVANSAGTPDIYPAVSRSDGNPPAASQEWSIVWLRNVSPNQEYHGAQIHADGTITNPSTLLVTFVSNVSVGPPSVSSIIDGTASPRDFLFVFALNTGGDNDIYYQYMSGFFPTWFDDLTTVENDGFGTEDQVSPQVDSDGHDFVFTYSESYMHSVTDYDIYLSSFNASSSGELIMIEAHQNLAFTPNLEYAPNITARHSAGGAGTRYAIVWTDAPSSMNNDVYGAIYRAPLVASFCSPSPGFTLACPCANPGSPGHGCDNSHATGGGILTSSGVSSLGADTLGFAQSGELPTSLSIFLQGNSSQQGGIAFGDGVRCATGTLKRLFTHNAIGGAVIAPTGSDLSVSARSAALGDTITAGSKRYYQVYYRDANLTFCRAGFNVGNALEVAWTP